MGYLVVIEVELFSNSGTSKCIWYGSVLSRIIGTGADPGGVGVRTPPFLHVCPIGCMNWICHLEQFK